MKFELFKRQNPLKNNDIIVKCYGSALGKKVHLLCPHDVMVKCI